MMGKAKPIFGLIVTIIILFFIIYGLTFLISSILGIEDSKHKKWINWGCIGLILLSGSLIRIFKPERTE